jgi:drug/metabolite transporter (DMT)-like permease
MAVKFFQLTIVAMVLNTAPLITFFLAMLFFKEKVTTGQIISLFAAFIGLLLMLFCGETEDKRPEFTPTIWAYILLLFNPFCLSAQ